MENKEENIKKSEDRLEILKRIEELEKEGKFDVDPEDDPPTIPLEADDVDYLKKKSYSKLKAKIADTMALKFFNSLVEDNKLIIKQVNGTENLRAIKHGTGVMVTCNHFNPFDSLTVEKIFRLTKSQRRQRMFKVIREGNYTNFPGLYGFFFRNCDTLPLSSNKRTMMKFIKAVNVILKRGDFILVYPEQSMWWNYRKPKPLKNGAFNLAARSKVPVIPIFITMEDSDIIGEDGFPIQEYIVNIGKPIYPDCHKSEKDNTEMLRDKNYEVWKQIYEDFYGIKLEYDILNENKETIS